jgi:hypothetical protein
VKKEGMKRNEERKCKDGDGIGGRGVKERGMIREGSMKDDVKK